MSADTLSIPARAFYEHTKGKAVMSCIRKCFFVDSPSDCDPNPNAPRFPTHLRICYTVGMGAMVLLARACYFAGDSQLVNNSLENVDDDEMEAGLTDLSAGLGFGVFFLIIGCILTLATSVYYSPFICGSANEKETLKVPMEDFAAPDDSPQV